MSELKAIREARGIRQNFVAGKLGIPQNYLYRYESGDVELPPRYIRPLAALYGVPVEKIVNAAYPEASESRS